MEEPIFNWLENRGAGLLLHPTSLPGRHGIGTLGAELRRFLAFLGSAGFTSWQMLPPGPTGYGDCPYSSFSAMAGNPYLIDLDSLIGIGLLTEEECAELVRLPQARVDFGRLYQIKWPILKLAYRRFVKSRKDSLAGYGSYRKFKTAKASWLDSYALFMALKATHAGRPWWEWPEQFRIFSSIDPEKLPRETREEIEAQKFYQYLFFGQWNAVRALAKEAGVSIVGDMPFYVCRDSADVWGAPENFDLDENLSPKAVAGVPPDYFSKDGQLWGNPLYNWKYLAANGYGWWMERLRAAFDIFDVVRLDHFRAFHDYWNVPADALTARKGEWLYGPGLDFFKKVREVFGNVPLIAEDLGDIDEGVRELLRATGLPGMAVLHFAFSCEPENVYLPHNHLQNQVLYAGTHDNDTSRGWYETLPPQAQDQFRRYFHVSGADVAWDMIRACYASTARLAVVTAQDLLSLDTRARMNIPGTFGTDKRVETDGVKIGNWQWRLTPDQFAQMLAHAPYLKEIGWLYGRLPVVKKTTAK